MANITREKFKTYENVFDNFTIRNLVDLAKKRHFLEGSLSPIKIGKEANVFSAEKEDGTKVCLKIYRLESANFNRMYEYIRSDPRFIGLSHKKRKIIFAWVQREYRNLVTANKNMVSAPQPIKFQFNVLIMSLIGKEQAAPMVKDLPPKHLRKFTEAVVENMKRLYNAGLVHGDLSRFNILNNDENPVLIDFSHTTPKNNPLFKILLDRDARNIADDFKQFTKQEILNSIALN